MKRFRLLSCIALTLGGAAARADLAPERLPEAASATPPPAASGRALDLDAEWAIPFSARGPAVPWPPSGDSATASEQAVLVEQLPALPGSASLCLWAFGSVGAWQLGRSARKLHGWRTVPDWYHTGGPGQVGHATPLDLEFSRAALPLCGFASAESAIGEPSQARWWLRPRSPKRAAFQRYLVNADPRGPPDHLS